MNPPEINVTPAAPLVPEPAAPLVPEQAAPLVPEQPEASLVAAVPETTHVPAIATPVEPATYRERVVAGARRPGVGVRQIGALVALLLLVLLGYKLTHGGGNTYEKTADAVTIAIINNDMRPVESDFNAVRIPELENRVQVARLSDMVAPLGAFKGSKEITPSGSAAGVHEFTETFANGSKFERFELDADGKILHFHIGDPPSTSTSQ